MNQKGALYFFTGKMGAGKTTYALKLSKDTNAVYISEDDMLTTLFPNEIRDMKDYMMYSNRIKPLVETLVTPIVDNGIDVILDFPGNTITQRSWFHQLITANKVNHTLYYIDEDDIVCLNHLKKRNIEQPKRRQFDTEEIFYKVTSYFQKPTKDEGFNIVINKKGGTNQQNR